uniref:Family with sequence similarity 174 member B n=1 Tax=Chelonoidis abingdonii TaxID=106734 RepID=A0A8C0J6K2_CHEAB
MAVRRPPSPRPAPPQVRRRRQGWGGRAGGGRSGGGAASCSLGLGPGAVWQAGRAGARSPQDRPPPRCCCCRPAAAAGALPARGRREPPRRAAAAQRPANASRRAEPLGAPGPTAAAQVSAAVIARGVLSAGLIGCLLLRVCRSGKRIKKTRKYDIITTPAERVEMAPLNEDEDDDEDSTVFDVKYRY